MQIHITELTTSKVDDVLHQLPADMMPTASQIHNDILHASLPAGGGCIKHTKHCTTYDMVIIHHSCEEMSTEASTTETSLSTETESPGTNSFINA